MIFFFFNGGKTDIIKADSRIVEVINRAAHKKKNRALD